MIHVESYLSQLIEKMQQQFGSRLLYVGLQGSYLRGEATDNSDLDMMIVLDGLALSDLAAYRLILQSMGHFDKSCGFICSKEDLANWNPLEICHLLNSTKDYYGTLRPLVPSYTSEDVGNFVKLSLNNLYHELCHRAVHGQPNNTAAALPGMYKGTFFILQNLHYLKSGTFLPSKAQLLEALKGSDRAVLQHAMELSEGMKYDADKSFALLFDWCQQTMAALAD